MICTGWLQTKRLKLRLLRMPHAAVTRLSRTVSGIILTVINFRRGWYTRSLLVFWSWLWVGTSNPSSILPNHRPSNGSTVVARRFRRKTPQIGLALLLERTGSAVGILSKAVC